MFGVSPSFFFSKYTTDFTVEDYIKGLPDLRNLGFTGFQNEIFLSERISEWERDAGKLKVCADELGMVPTQFVAHFMLFACKDDDALFCDCGYEEFRRVVAINKIFGSDVVTLPVAPYDVKDAVAKPGDYEKRWSRFCEKIAKFCDIAADAGMKVGMEIVPGSLLGNTDGLLRLIAETGKDNLGLNFDTGHAWSSKERIEFIPSKLGGRIWGTHLKDNFTFENLPLPPGKGNIPWKLVIAGLRENGYKGSLDLEINSKTPADVASDYSFGKTYLEKNCRAEDI